VGAEGTLAWTRLARAHRKDLPLGGGPAKAIETGEPDGHLEDLPKRRTPPGARDRQALEVYAPIRSEGEVVGAYETYADAAPLEASIADRRRAIWVTTAAVFALLWRRSSSSSQRRGR
jgi:hypothetical protein